MSEPILLGLAPALVTGLIAALANVLRAFGFGDITQQQIDALNGAALAIMLVLAALGSWWARQHSTPTASPTLPVGTTVTVTDPSPDVADVKTVL
jgi:hypothetical protein